MLEIRDLYVRYGGVQAVQGVSLSIRRGSIVTLVGANGAGKSSVIRSIAGLNKTVSGEILLRHIAALAQELGLSVTAEGVETERQASFIWQLRCNDIQGYYYSKPLAQKDYEHYLQPAANQQVSANGTN